MSNLSEEYDFFEPSKNLREVKVSREPKKWIRCKEGTQIYSMGKTKFLAMAREAGAAVQIDRTILVDSEMFDRYLETFRVPKGVL